MIRAARHREDQANMGLRDKLTTRVAPLLEPGEKLQQVFPAQGGISPWLGNGFGLVGAMVLTKRRIIAVTDRAVVVMAANRSGTSPTEVLKRLPRGTTIGDVKGVYAKVQLDGEKLYVHKRFHGDVRAADGVIAS
jgi:hypothetical protein